MSIIQQRKILSRIAELETDIATLKRVRVEIATIGYASSTMSSGGGSKSWTAADVDKIASAISAMIKELRQLRAVLGGTTGKRTIIVYS